MARAHVLARRAIARAAPGALVGYAHSAPLVLACDPSRRRDRLAARLRDWAWNELFPRRVAAAAGGRGSGLDFLGINYYTRTLTRASGLGSGLVLGRACREPHHADRGPSASTGQEVWPAGLTRVLERFARLGVPLYVTENGVATDDEELRTRALLEHLAALQQALARGVDVRGYFYWSLLDNFEWRLGTSARFGLYAVDFATQARSERPAARAYAAVCRRNALTTDGAGA
jgi:beta-glucosidase/6-phospho-beta-glucosidase/beta-galactosidase